MGNSTDNNKNDFVSILVSNNLLVNELISTARKIWRIKKNSLFLHLALIRHFCL